jgi:1-acyl-sn-glycerol-3-phosphate acyltransferase
MTPRRPPAPDQPRARRRTTRQPGEVTVPSIPTPRSGRGTAVSEARVIPLHADDAGARTRWRLGGPQGTGSHRTGPPEPVPVPVAAAAPEPAAEPEPPAWEEALAASLAFLRRRFAGEYAVDEFGFDPDLTDNVLLPALRPLYQKWFRVETIGMHNVPSSGGALVVANHSGTLPLDSLMTAVALHDDHPAQRHLRMLGADLMFRLPVVGALARKQGGTLACTPDAERLMTSGELVGVWPEGFKGIGKPFRDRYKLQRFGRGGFVSAALRTGVPIIPCSIVGAEEIYPKIGDLKPVARLFGAPYFPVTPLFPLLGPLGLVPLPSKWYMEFGEPIRTDTIGAAEADDPMTVFNLSDQVRETIQHTLYRLLSQRRNAFLG